MDDHPIRLTVDDDLRRSRLTVFFRLLLAIPHFVWLALWTVAAIVVGILNWFAVLITTRTPQPFHRFLAAYIRYSTQVGAFVALAANPFPGFVGATGYPVDVEIAEPQRQRRLITLFKLVLVLPALAIGELLGGGALTWGGVAGFAALLAWFAALVTGRMPSGLRDLLAWSLGYGAQVAAYVFSVTDRYPMSDPNEHVDDPAPVHTIRLELEDDARRSRLTVFFRLLLAIPHIVWLYLWGVAVAVAVIVGWFAALALGRLPQALHRFSAAYVSYAAQVYAFIFMIANPFPGFVGGPYPVQIVIDPPSRQHRLVTLFRIVLALPAFLIGASLAYLLYLIGFLGWFVALFTGRMPVGLRNSGAAAIRYTAQTYAYTMLLTSRYPHASPALRSPPEPEPEPALEPLPEPAV